MLEKMADFFDSRLDGYDKHMLTNIAFAREFYPFTARALPCRNGAKILDLGCGTGLELAEYFALAPEASVTGIDLAPAMLAELKRKFSERDITLILGSYFDVPFGEKAYDAAVSVESLHHFTKEEKIPLYAKLCFSLKSGGYFILTDYFSLSDEEENEHRAELLRLKKEQSISDKEFYHYDTPLTVAHETEALLAGGFTTVEVMANWGATFTLKASVS
ncbi:MAG: class I SAM-dependent methyltransferase [Clostridia bacterium]|nr:class I SAM-dependent methyltransferase [Clostridia bacterium]